MYKNKEGPVVLKSEVKSTLAKGNRSNASRPDQIVMEIVSAKDDFRIDILTEIINEIYDSSGIP